MQYMHVVDSKNAKMVQIYQLGKIPQPPKNGLQNNLNFFSAYFESTSCCPLLSETNQNAIVYTQACSLSVNTFKIMISSIVTKLWGPNFAKNANFVKF